MGKTEKLIEAMRKNKEPWMISEDSIAFMCDFVSKLEKPRVLEVGTYHGYSALHFSRVSKDVVTIEASEEGHEIAKNNLKIAKNVKCILGDAKEEIGRHGKFDVIFLDAMKSEYATYLQEGLKVLNHNGVVFADNTISHKDEMDEFFEYLKKSELVWKELKLGRGLVMITRNKLTEILITSHLLKFLKGKQS